MKIKTDIPEEILNIAEKLRKAGFAAYLVGGCVRDLLIGREPNDWDIAADAKPEEIQKVFAVFAGATAAKPATVYENEFGTVAVKTGSADERLKIVEITTFRLEGKYTDKRHPDEIKFAETIEEDLARRDFTINAAALDLKSETPDSKFVLIDPFGGLDDLKNKIIRTVGKPEERFDEDALRLMRAVRFSCQLNFVIADETAEAIKKKAGLLEAISKERIRDELEKILMTENASSGIQMLEDFNLLRHIMPELREGINVGQNKHHTYAVWEHNLRALDYAAKKNYSLEIRMAALLHDVGKPKTKSGEGPDCTFYGHEVVGARMAAKILDNLRFPKSFIESVSHLVRCHLFYYNVGEVTAAGVRRFLSRVGPENIDNLIKVREADRIGSGVPKAVPYKLRHLLFMIEKVKKDPISPKMLKVSGEDVMKILGISPGPRVGWILSILLDEVIENPRKNERNDLEFGIGELGKLSDKELAVSSKKAREKKEEFESGIEEEIKKKYYVK